MSNDKLRDGGAGFIGDLVRMGGDVFAFHTNETLSESGPSFWADMARLGGNVIDEAPPPTEEIFVDMEPPTPPAATEGVAYEWEAIASGGNGGPFTYSEGGGLWPTGISLDPDTGAITGTPTVPGSYVSLYVVADDGVNPSGLSSPFDIEVAETPLVTAHCLDHATPPVVTDLNANPINIGVVFRATVDAQILGIWFYKHADDPTLIRDVGIWNANGAGGALALGTSSGEAAGPGWTYIELDAPFTPTVGSYYCAGVNSPARYYVATTSFFDDAGPFGAEVYLPNNTELDFPLAQNGRFVESPGLAFPSQTFASNNYFVDVEYTILP